MKNKKITKEQSVNRLLAKTQNLEIINENGITLQDFIMNTPDGMEVEFINGNRLDCRKANMKLIPKKK